jgi:glycerol uptake facilitator-like aquaporin
VLLKAAAANRIILVGKISLVGVTHTAHALLLLSCRARSSSASLNPARDLGPRLVVATIGRWGWAVAFRDWLPYLVGPMVGGRTYIAASAAPA